MTVNDIYKCSNVDEDTRFVIDTKEPETIYDGPWYYINDELKKQKSTSSASQSSVRRTDFLMLKKYSQRWHNNPE